MRAAAAAFALLVLSVAPMQARAARVGHSGGGFRGHGGFHGPPPHFHPGFHPGFRPGFRSHFGARVFIGGAFWDPWYYYPPYYAPAPYPYPPPPPDDAGWSSPPPEEQTSSADDQDDREQPSDDDAARASYGLLQLHGIPDGAAVDLDGRFWMTAKRLDDRWLALPQGDHQLTVRVDGTTPVERSLNVTAGKTQVVRFGPFPRPKS